MAPTLQKKATHPMPVTLPTLFDGALQWGVFVPLTAPLRPHLRTTCGGPSARGRVRKRTRPWTCLQLRGGAVLFSGGAGGWAWHGDRFTRRQMVLSFNPKSLGTPPVGMAIVKPGEKNQSITMKDTFQHFLHLGIFLFHSIFTLVTEETGITDKPTRKPISSGSRHVPLINGPSTIINRVAQAPRFAPTGKVGSEGTSSVALLDAVEAPARGKRAATGGNSHAAFAEVMSLLVLFWAIC